MLCQIQSHHGEFPFLPNSLSHTNEILSTFKCGGYIFILKMIGSITESLRMLWTNLDLVLECIVGPTTPPLKWSFREKPAENRATGLLQMSHEESTAELSLAKFPQRTRSNSVPLDLEIGISPRHYFILLGRMPVSPLFNGKTNFHLLIMHFWHTQR